jgi:hypothetical protein
LAHRLSYCLFVSDTIPDGGVVRHSCDNPPCCNPAHLEIGSTLDNSRDAVERNRVDHGSSRYNAKLTEADIPIIRALIASGLSSCEIGRQYGVDGRAISLIRDGKRWARA